MKKHASKEEKAKMVNEYFKGKSIANLCLKHQIKKSALYSWIHSSTDEIKQSRFEATPENKKNVVALVKNGKTVKEVCTKFSIKPSTVYHWVTQYGSETVNGNKVERKKKIINMERIYESIEILKQTSVTNDMNNLEKTELIRSLSTNRPVALLCKLFELSRATYYAYLHKRLPAHLLRDKQLKILVMETYLRHKKRIGAAKIRQDLSLQAQTVSLKKIYQLMKELKITKIVPKKNPYIRLSKKTNKNCHNHLNQQFDQIAPNLVWVSDITEIKINRSPVYLCAIMDLFSRKIIAHQVSRKNNTRLTLMTIDQAIENRKEKPHLFHSDRGVQYTALKFQKHLQKLEITQSFSAPGYPYDNSPMESFFATFKKETIKKLVSFKLIQDYIKLVNEYMMYYNSIRPHRGLGMRTPIDKENIYSILNSSR